MEKHLQVCIQEISWFFQLFFKRFCKKRNDDALTMKYVISICFFHNLILVKILIDRYFSTWAKKFPFAMNRHQCTNLFLLSNWYRDNRQKSQFVNFEYNTKVFQTISTMFLENLWQAVFGGKNVWTFLFHRWELNADENVFWH